MITSFVWRERIGYNPLLQLMLLHSGRPQSRSDSVLRLDHSRHYFLLLFRCSVGDRTCLSAEWVRNSRWLTITYRWTKSILFSKRSMIFPNIFAACQIDRNIPSLWNLIILLNHENFLEFADCGCMWTQHTPEARSSAPNSDTWCRASSTPCPSTRIPTNSFWSTSTAAPCGGPRFCIR